MGMTQPEAIAERLKQECKRLYGGALIRVSLDSYPNDDGADLYIYAPKKFSDMLLAKLKIPGNSSLMLFARIGIIVTIF